MDDNNYKNKELGETVNKALDALEDGGYLPDRREAPNPFKEYSMDPVNLQDVLEQLALYCMESGEKDPSITVILPKKAQERHALQMWPKEKVKLESDNGKKPSLSRLFVVSGVVNILNSDEYEAVTKASTERPG